MINTNVRNVIRKVRSVITGMDWQSSWYTDIFPFSFLPLCLPWAWTEHSCLSVEKALGWTRLRGISHRTHCLDVLMYKLGQDMAYFEEW